MLKHPVRALFLILLATGCLVAQQRALTHADYDDWQSLRGTAYSHDGAWVAYQIEPQWGDGVLVVRQTNGDKTYRHERGSGARFSADGRFVAFTVEESKVEARDKKIEELRQQAKRQREGGEAEAARAGRGSGGSGGAAAAAASRRRGAGAAGGRRGAGGGGRFGRGGGGGGDTASGSGDLRLLDLATGKVESIGKVRRWLLSDDVGVLMYQKQGDAPNADEEGDAAGGEEQPTAGSRGGGRRGARPPSSEPEPAAPSEPAVTGEPVATEEPAAAGAGEAGATGGRGGARRRGGRSGRPETPSDPLEQKRPAGYELTVRDLASGTERSVADVVQFGLSRRGKWLWFHTSAKQPQKDASYGLFLQSSAGGATTRLLDGIANVANVTMDRDEQIVAFTSDLQDFAADKPQSDLYLWQGGDDGARRIAYSGANGMPAKKLIGGGVSFSRDGSVLSFSVQDPPEPEPLPILPEDKVDLDIWNWRDGLLQTMQQKGRGRGRGDSLTAVWHRGSDKLIVLGDERTPSLRFVGPEGQRMIATDSDPYEQEVQWDGRYSDVWLVDSRDGTRQKVLEKLRTNVTNSPGGRYLIWFDENYHWWTMDTGTGVRRDLTGSLAVPFHRHDDDHPEPDSAYGIAGWTENDGAVLLYDEFDVWKVSPQSGQAVCVTDGYGREHRLELRLQRLPRAADDEDPWVDQELLLAAKDVETMAEGFFADALHRTQKPVKLMLVDKAIGGLTSPPDSGRMFFTQSTFAEFPDLWTSKADFSDMRRLSDANPQQADYRWGQAELVHWIDGDGQSRKGVLVKPDGFDPQKQYPMMVYFYEKLSDRLHSYVTPQPGTSPNASYYVSNGYLWFQPDIVYEEGYPGPSCVKCIVSGVQHLIAQGFVDRDAIGAAGHSWGGYQTAYLVTQTNIFKAVESGAPVSNMLSAYGGIRYDSGMSRQFQYEQSQSRIGGTPWQYPLRYQVNSPIYFADKVQTPVLMLHNDADGAVPWTQGIEYFVALKRLGKEAYLFNYNGEPHGLRKRQNQKDWSRRMSEYFDHHLKGAPAPEWMIEGVPYADRDVEKLPFAQSYIDAHVKQPKAKPEAEEAQITESPAAEASTGDPEPAPAASRATSGAGSAAGSENGGDTKAAAGTAVRERPTAPDRAEQGTTPVAGQPAPAFTQFDEAGIEHQLTDYRGRKLLVWFYPKADTPGCTTQGCGLRDAFASLERNGVAVLGVSFDDDKANTAFRQKHDFPFPLLCDTERKMGIAYGAAADAGARNARRIAFLIGPDGKIVQVWNHVDVQSFAADVLASLSL